MLVNEKMADKMFRRCMYSKAGVITLPSVFMKNVRLC